MALGSILLQPRTLDRLQPPDEAAALREDIQAVLQRVMASPDRLEAVAGAFQRGFQAMTEELRQDLEPRLPHVLDELRGFVQPVLATVQRLAATGQQADNPLQLLGMVSQLLDELAAVVQAVSLPQLRALAHRVESLLSDTCGLSQTALRDQLRRVLGRARTELLAGGSGQTPDTAVLCQSLAALLGRIEELSFANVPALDLDPDRLAEAALGWLQRSGFEQVREKLAGIIEKVRAALTAGASLASLAAPNGFGPGSLGAAQAPAPGDQYCWYASWLFASERQGFLTSFLPGYPNDEVWISADKKQLILRRAFADDEVLHEVTSGQLRWQDAPQFNTATSTDVWFTVDRLPKDFLETWTQLSATLVEFVRAVSHTVSFATSPKDYAANIPLALWSLARALSDALGGAPLPALVTKQIGVGQGFQWLFALVPGLSVGLGSLEGKHTVATGGNIFNEWLTLLGGDALSALKIAAITSTVHDCILSLFTLINYDGPAGAPDPDNRPRNRERGDPIIGVTCTFSAWLLTRMLKREDYKYPDLGNPQFWLNQLYAALMGVAGGLVGTLLVWAVSRTYDFGQLGKQIGIGAAKSLLFVLQQYGFMENDTDGKYNPGAAAFLGYPDRQSSPYKLPFAGGNALWVPQGNQGMFSHMKFNDQVYAYDIAHDMGEEVLCSRDGTVVDYYDWIPDNIDPDAAQRTAAQTEATAAGVLRVGQSGEADAPGWNFIMVRHDTKVSGHDNDAGAPGRATTVTTYAVYGHGKKESVRGAFFARGVAANAIIGTAVTQGDVLMLADDTGFSFHSHLHMHVKVGPDPGAITSGTSMPPVREATFPNSYTIPFVFQEVSPMLGTGGVLKSLTWYRSGNRGAP